MCKYRIIWERCFHRETLLRTLIVFSAVTRHRENFDLKLFTILTKIRINTSFANINPARTTTPAHKANKYFMTFKVIGCDSLISCSFLASAIFIP